MTTMGIVKNISNPGMSNMVRCYTAKANCWVVGKDHPGDGLNVSRRRCRSGPSPCRQLYGRWDEMEAEVSQPRGYRKEHETICKSNNSATTWTHHQLQNQPSEIIVTKITLLSMFTATTNPHIIQRDVRALLGTGVGPGDGGGVTPGRRRTWYNGSSNCCK